MVQKRKRQLVTLSFGAEPGMPDVPALADWVAKRRDGGVESDLITYLLEAALAPQLEAAITIPCSGGRFYASRLLSSFTGIKDGVIRGETVISDRMIVADSAELVLQKKGVWCAVPAPHILSIRDEYYYDEDEAFGAVADLYRGAMRAMRDAGIYGHVLICDRADNTELAALSRQKVFFFLPQPGREDLEVLLEHQRRIAVDKGHLEDVFDLSDEYELRQLVIIDADHESIASALSHFDPEQVVIGGYCTTSCESYWKDLIKGAYYTA
ncbi:MAG: hypothetical protein A4E35_00070 [Methanoregula sp. PtaU1.Bin051]|nr:MAG: hypothetical protein A4E35_00070 [Methanoregula sp. PtaU1.Bin051]